MAKVIEGLLYSESHEWVKVEGEYAFIGISDFAQHSMGALSYVDMPDVDDELEQGEEFGAVESVKAASDLYSPVSGTVVEVNEALEDAPELLNEDAYSNWSNTDWAWNKNASNPESYLDTYSVFERDSTHCSYELGRYTAGAAVYANIYEIFN